MTKVMQQVFVGIHREQGYRTIEFCPPSSAAMDSLKTPDSPVALATEQDGAVGVLVTNDTPRVVLEKLSDLLRRVFPDGYNGFAGSSIEFDTVVSHLKQSDKGPQSATRQSGVSRLVSAALPTFIPHPPKNDSDLKLQRSTD